jgi:hypothetical protein
MDIDMSPREEYSARSKIIGFGFSLQKLKIENYGIYNYNPCLLVNNLIKNYSTVDTP